MREPIFRQYRSSVWSRESFKCSASRSTSSSLIHTKPGAPVQQFPQQVQVNESPPAYQGGGDGITGKVIAMTLLIASPPSVNRNGRWERRSAPFPTTTARRLKQSLQVASPMDHPGN